MNKQTIIEALEEMATRMISEAAEADGLRSRKLMRDQADMYIDVRDTILKGQTPSKAQLDVIREALRLA